MRIDRSHRPWAIGVALATLVAALLYGANVHPRWVPLPLPAFFGASPPALRSVGGTPLGLVFGSLALLIFLFAAALGLRKKKRLWPLGPVQLWLRAHLWLSVLTLPLVVFHCGWRTGGAHTTWLIVLYGLVMLSGFFGVFVQHFVPGLMKERLPREIVFEAIPQIRRDLLHAAQRLREEIREPAAATPVLARAGGGGALPEPDSSVGVLADFLDGEALPYLAAGRGDGHRLGAEHEARETFRALELSVAARWRPRLEELRGWCELRRFTDVQTSLHHWLHGWLFLHVPASLALLLWTLWHAWVAIGYLAFPR
jgi:hypothetical protein